MITDSFHENETPIMGPEDFYKANGKLGKTCIIFFSLDVLEKALKDYQTEVVATISASVAREKVYRIKGTEILFYHSQMGSPSAGMLLDEARFLTGATSFIVFGSSGVLNNEIAKGKIIVPNKAYRDEGFSYHFRKPSDYIEMKNASVVASFMERHHIPFALGGTWTTDAFYHETREEMAKRAKEGCIAVDMEASGLESLCEYRNVNYYTFFFGGDLLDAPIWDHSNLGDEKEKKSQQDAFDIAFLLAQEITE